MIILLTTIGMIYKHLLVLKKKQENISVIEFPILNKKYDNMTIIDILKFVSEKYPKIEALKIKQNNTWKTINYSEYYKMVKNFAQSLNYFLGTGVNVAIYGYNSSGWFYSYLGTMMNCGTYINIDHNINNKTLKKIINKCKIEMLVIENDKILSKLLQLGKTSIKLIVYYSPINPKIIKKIPSDIILLGMTTFMSKKNKLEKNPSVNDIAQIIYKNRTLNGSSIDKNPKGVMLTHQNLMYSVKKFLEILKLKSSVKLAQERIVSYLPLSNLFTQYMDIFIPICTLSTVWFSDKNALDNNKPTLIKTFGDVKPTILLGNINLWNLFKNKITNEINSISGSLTKTLTPWKILDTLYLTNCKYFINLDNNISNDLLNYFKLNDINLHKIFGDNETSGIIAFEAPGMSRINSVGLPICEIKISNTNQLYLKGNNVFVGYFEDQKLDNDFFEKKNDQHIFTNDGFLITKYLAKMDTDNFIYTDYMLHLE
jgi:long-subunit acyl-CoA synthetase (AMP-forming)